MRKIPKFENARFISAGAFASVFAVEFEERELAVKLNKSYLTECTEIEFSRLRDLEGIAGIPRPYKKVSGIFTLKELGLVIPRVGSVFAYSDSDYQSVANPFFMQYFSNAVQLEKAGPQSHEYFDKLEFLVTSVHSRGFSLAADFGCCNVLVCEENPVVVDWYMSCALPSNEKRRNQIQDRDFKEFSWLRRKYQRK